jgi:hypothetical protein
VGRNLRLIWCVSLRGSCGESVPLAGPAHEREVSRSGGIPIEVRSLKLLALRL